tara:strand:+ start:2472 stop:2924 length:453 start_codon:yes stop_codon:yes gene_type:complete
MMIVDPPQYKASIKTEAIAGMKRCGHSQRLSQSNYKWDTTQKNMKISGICNTQTRIFINPAALKGIKREPASVKLEIIEQGVLIPASWKKRRPIPLAAQGLEKGFIDLHQTLALKKAQWVLQLQLQIASALPGVLACDQTMHQRSQQGST